MGMPGSVWVRSAFSSAPCRECLLVVCGYNQKPLTGLQLSLSIWLDRRPCQLVPHYVAHLCRALDRHLCYDGRYKHPCDTKETGMFKRIALIHATPVAMQPVVEAFRQGWPGVDTFNVLDDALSTDLARAGTLNEALQQRIASLATYATGIGVDGILYTCSAFGEAIEAVARTAQIPVLKPNEAMFEDVLQRGTRIGLLATFQPSIPSLEQEFVDMARAQAKDVTLESVCVPEAMTALTTGDAEQHDRLIAEAAARLAHCEVVMLAQFSMARARSAVQQVLGDKVLTSPDSAVAKLKAVLTGVAR